VWRVRESAVRARRARVKLGAGGARNGTVQRRRFGDERFGD